MHEAGVTIYISKTLQSDIFWAAIVHQIYKGRAVESKVECTKSLATYSLTLDSSLENCRPLDKLHKLSRP